MRYAKAFGLMLLAVFALSAVMASGASAAGEILGAAGTESTTKDNGSATFETSTGGITVKCTSSEGTLKSSSNTEATFDELFLGCNAAGIKCTGLTDTTTGSILAKGKVVAEAFKEGETLKLASIFTLEPAVHFTCAGILTEVRGSVIGVVSTASGSKGTTITTALTGSKGKETPVEVNGVNHHLESSTGGAAFAESSQIQNVTATGTVEVEPMY